MTKKEEHVISTVYNGIKYRSRTEARWARFFDAAGIHFTYEPETFILPSGPYLPDFELHIYPKQKVYAEVKGKEFTFREKKRCLEVAKMTKSDIFLLDGKPDFKAYSLYKIFKCSCGRDYHGRGIKAHLVDRNHEWYPYNWDPIYDYYTRRIDKVEFKERFPDTAYAIMLAQTERFGVYE